MTYAKGTSVTVQSSQQEIGRTFARYGVETYSFGAGPGFALVEFMHVRLPIRLRLPLPDKPATRKAPNPKTGRTFDAWAGWEQDVRESWRALALFIKAALESTERGLVRPEQAFMAFLVTGDGSTMGERMLPAYVAAVGAGQLLELDPPPPGGV
ncbi:MAG: hypothetical protein GC157_18540 [Frankiales bacterium]|nr:hypothetical protein [Frankiales bacterium]